MKEKIKRLHLTQTEFGKIIGVSQRTVSAWCNRQREPRIEQLPIIAKTLGVSVEEVIACFKHDN